MTTARRQIIVVGALLIFTLAAGTMLEGGPTPEVSATLAKIKSRFKTRPSRRLHPLPAAQISEEAANIQRFSHPLDADALASSYSSRASAYLQEHQPEMAKHDLDAAILLNADPNVETKALQERFAIYAYCDRNYVAALADLDRAKSLQKGVSQGPGAICRNAPSFMAEWADTILRFAI